MRLDCIGTSMFSGWCCKEVHVYRFPHNITYPYSTCVSSIFVVASLLLPSFLFVFSLFTIYTTAYTDQMALKQARRP